ncbi:MAG: NPCBM/NEW2 domain-containing protein, partial [Phycisphaerae bacterium]|nr:NPCBM/NEW2 domain-containing protein [Phycisphaerae bacterium]
MSRHQTISALFAGCLVVTSFTPVEAADPVWYARENTWRDTITTSLDNQAMGLAAATARAQVPSPGDAQSSMTKVLKGGQQPVDISVPVRAWKDLILLVTDGGDGIGGDHAVWANARLIDAAGQVTWLDTLKPKAFKVGWGNLDISKNDTRRPVVMGNKPFPRYLFAHAVSAIHYGIEGRYERFEATVGIDQRTHPAAGSVNFMVTRDPKRIPEVGTPEIGTFAHPIWEVLLRDFPDSRQDILVLHDWLRQDKLKIDGASDRFKTPAASALKSATETLAYVTKSA